MNIVFVKFGQKYQSRHVNRLAAQLKQYYPKSNIWCYTDDPFGLEGVIPILKFKKINIPGWWNKLTLFSDEMPFVKGEKCFFLDLDSNVNFDPGGYFDWYHDRVTIMSDYTKRDNDIYKEKMRLDTQFNSSVITWYAGEVGYVWEKFMSNKDYYLRKYVGIDRFFMWEKSVKVNTFEDGCVNSVANPYGMECPIDTWDNLEFTL